MDSLKLSVTVRTALQSKYAAAAIKKIDQAVARWIKADAARGIQTVHVALDSAQDLAKWNIAPLSANPSAELVKSKIDALWKALGPDYLVLFGGPDVVPMFEEPNPSLDTKKGDDDPLVPTDNPYACSTAFKAGAIDSYMVPDRVVGRIPDLPGSDDPAWFCDYLATVSKHVPQPAKHYDKLYAVTAKEWLGGGQELVQFLGRPPASLLVSPPETDASATTKAGLKFPLHAIKCHGAQLDPRFFGQSGSKYPTMLSSASIKSTAQSSTLVAAGCCYGAQLFDIDDPAAILRGEWPIASAYLRGGAVGFMGATMIAWVGPQTMTCGDWIVAQYLKSALEGASLGRAMLEAKQQYLRWIAQQGWSVGKADQKTLIEFVLLGDPALHPVFAAPPGQVSVAAAVPSMRSRSTTVDRHRRRLLSQELAKAIRASQPERRNVRPAQIPKSALNRAARAARVATGNDFKRFGMARHEDVIMTVAQAAGAPVAAAAAGGTSRRSDASRATYEYYWSGRVEHKRAIEIRMVAVETDSEGTVLRTRVMHAAKPSIGQHEATPVRNTQRVRRAGGRTRRNG